MCRKLCNFHADFSPWEIQATGLCYLLFVTLYRRQLHKIHQIAEFTHTKVYTAAFARTCPSQGESEDPVREVIWILKR
jgi:hypothetical protein